ncbi:hypothetical protein AAE478_007638 [Parahypoxylon ruwenzoriense]
MHSIEKTVAFSKPTNVDSGIASCVKVEPNKVETAQAEPTGDKPAVNPAGWDSRFSTKRKQQHLHHLLPRSSERGSASIVLSTSMQQLLILPARTKGGRNAKSLTPRSLRIPDPNFGTFGATKIVARQRVETFTDALHSPRRLKEDTATFFIKYASLDTSVENVVPQHTLLVSSVRSAAAGKAVGGAVRFLRMTAHIVLNFMAL